MIETAVCADLGRFPFQNFAWKKSRAAIATSSGVSVQIGGTKVFRVCERTALFCLGNSRILMCNEYPSVDSLSIDEIFARTSNVPVVRSFSNPAIAANFSINTLLVAYNFTERVIPPCHH